MRVRGRDLAPHSSRCKNSLHHHIGSHSQRRRRASRARPAVACGGRPRPCWSVAPSWPVPCARWRSRPARRSPLVLSPPSKRGPLCRPPWSPGPSSLLRSSAEAGPSARQHRRRKQSCARRPRRWRCLRYRRVLTWRGCWRWLGPAATRGHTRAEPLPHICSFTYIDARVRAQLPAVRWRPLAASALPLQLSVHHPSGPSMCRCLDP